MKNIYEFIENLNIDCKYVVVAVSGGPDSMLLLNILLEMKEKLNFEIVVAHVHHNLRKESDAEAERLKNFCNEKNIIFEFKKINSYKNNKFSESSARKLRYEFFDKLIKKYNSNILFTAHHGDDLIETILMRIVRGSSIKGYAGFSAISIDRGYKIVKPLITLTKDQIITYLNEKNIYYDIDMSNLSDKYTRNRYRNHILPELKKENSNVNFKFLEFSKKLLSVDLYLKKEAGKFLKKLDFIDVKKFNELDNVIKLYVIEEYLHEVYKENIIYLNDRHVDFIINVMLKDKNCIFDLPINKKGIIEYNTFRIDDKKSKKAFDFKFTNNIQLPNNKKIYIDNNTTITTNYVIHLNSNDIKLPFHVRTRRSGDIMTVKNMGGRKKINDIFIDSKIPRNLRDEIPIVTDDTGEILWIPGVKKSHLDRKKDQKYDIILKYD